MQWTGEPIPELPQSGRGNRRGRRRQIVLLDFRGRGRGRVVRKHLLPSSPSRQASSSARFARGPLADSDPGLEPPPLLPPPPTRPPHREYTLCPLRSTPHHHNT